MQDFTRFESGVEGQLRRAGEAQSLDHLPGSGKPIPGAGTKDDAGWWIRAWLEREREAERLSQQQEDLERELGALWMLPDEQAVRVAVDRLNGGLSDDVEPLDITQVLTTWRAMSAARRPRP